VVEWVAPRRLAGGPLPDRPGLGMLEGEEGAASPCAGFYKEIAMRLPRGVKTAPDGRIVFHVPPGSPLNRVMYRDRRGRFLPHPRVKPVRRVRFRKIARKRRPHYCHRWHDARGRFCLRPPMSLGEIIALAQVLKLGAVAEHFLRGAWQREQAGLATPGRSSPTGRRRPR